jgi:hypothetical protein
MFWTLLVHHQGIHKLLYKTVTKQYFDLLHIGSGVMFPVG